MPTKLERLLYLQGNRCFFCDAPLSESEASVEHLVASANGGTNDDDNCVVCCKTLNAMLGSMSIKKKMEVVLNHRGPFRCPNGADTSLPATGNAPTLKPLAEDVDAVMTDLRRRNSAKPKTVERLKSTIRSLFQKRITKERLDAIVEHLAATGFIAVNGKNVAYPES